MAIRSRKGRKRPYEVYWNNPFTGKRESASFETEIEAKKEDSLVRHRLVFERESFKREEAGQEEILSAPTLEECWLLYLKQKQFSLKSVRWQVTSMRLILSEIGNIPVSKITKPILERVKSILLSTGTKPVTTRGKLSVLRTVLRWGAEQGFIDDMPVFPKLPPAHYEKLIPPTPEEAREIIEHALPHIVRLVILGAQFGVRVGESEAFKLTWEDVDLDGGLIRVHGAKKNADSPWRDVPIPESMVSTLLSWRDEDAKTGCNYIIQYDAKPVKSVKKAWATALLRAGITRRIRPYDLRHAFATNAIAAGADIGTVAKLMGHSTPTMILNHYQYVMDSQKKAVVEALPDLLSCGQVHVAKKKSPTANAVRD